MSDNRPVLYDFIVLLLFIRYGDNDGGFGGCCGRPGRTSILFLSRATGCVHVNIDVRHLSRSMQVMLASK